MNASTCRRFAGTLNLRLLTYDCKRYYRRDNNEIPIRTITALLLLSTKYDFKHIRTDIIVHISKHYPMDLDEYEEINGDEDSPLFAATRIDCHIPLLKAVFTADVDVLLPILYYACCSYSIGTIFDHAGSLGLECVRILIEGREKLASAMNELIAKLPEHVSGLVCLNNLLCAREARFVDLEESFNQTDLVEIAGYTVARDHLRGICPRCNVFTQTFINKQRQELWEKVPSYFGFSAWGELQEKLSEIK